MAVLSGFGVRTAFGVLNAFGVLPAFGTGGDTAVSSTQSTLVADPWSFDADGVATSTVTLTPKDAEGNTLSLTATSFTARVGTVDVATCTLALSASSITDDGLDTTVLTLTAPDTDGDPLVGIPVSGNIALTGTTNLTVTPLDTVTSAAGVARWSIVSETAASYTIGATVRGATVTDTAALTVTGGGGVAPVLLEDFSTYTDTADFISDPRGIYLTVEDFRTDQMAIDTGVGYGALTQSLRYDYPSGTGTDYTISRMLDMPATADTEVWVEAVVRWSADFTIAGNGQPAGSALKLMHVEVNGVAGRFAVNLEGSTARAEGPNDDYDDLYINPSPGVSVSTLFDGSPHIIRYHVQLGTTDLHEFSVDGVYQGQATGATSATDFWGIALCRNLNKLAANAMEMWWHRVAVYDTDPGWEEFA